MIGSGMDRNRLDRYWTDQWITDELFKHCDGYIPKTIWEPAAGRGDMAAAIEFHQRSVAASDIDMSEFSLTSAGWDFEADFLTMIELPWTVGGQVKGIITNPPYQRMAEKFIRHGLKWLDHPNVNLEFMAMILRSEFKSGKTRHDIFGECPHYLGELVLTTRPRWDLDEPDRPDVAHPRHNYSWFMWKSWHNEGAKPIQIFSYMPPGFTPA